MSKMTFISLPESFLNQYYEESVHNFLFAAKRFNDVNINKSSPNNPHKTEVVVGNIHRYVFLVLGKRFLPAERSETTTKCLRFKLNSKDGVKEVLSDLNTTRVHKTGDVTIAAPSMIMNCQMAL